MDAIRFALAVAWKELQVLFKDKGAMALFFLLPLMITGLMGAPQIMSWRANAEAGRPTITLRLALVNEDAGAYGQEVVKALQQIDILELQVLSDAAAADRLVADREVEGAILIPATFSQKIDNYESSALQVIVDPTQAATTGLITGILDTVADEVNLVGEIRYGIRSILDESPVMAEADPVMRQAVEAQTLGVIMTQLNERRQSPAISVVTADMTGRTAQQELDMAISIMTLGMAVLFAFFVVTTITNSFYYEKEIGSFRRLLASPIPVGSIIAGKMLAYMVIVLLQIVIMLGVANLAFGMSMGQSPLALLLVTVLLAAVVTALGMFLAAVTRSQQQAFSIAMILAIVLGGLGGCFLGIPEMFVFRSDSLMGTLARLTPQGNAMQAFSRVIAEGAGVVDILPQLGILLAMSIVLYLLAIWRFRFD